MMKILPFDGDPIAQGAAVAALVIAWVEILAIAWWLLR